jgi:hypothetical protein
MDKGQTYQRTGIIGWRLNPYVKSYPKSKRNLRMYQAVKILGIAQMFVIAPLFLKKQIDWDGEFNRKYDPPYPDIESPPYVGYFFLFLYTGALTNQVLARPFIKKSLKEYHRLNNSLGE